MAKRVQENCKILKTSDPTWVSIFYLTVDRNIDFFAVTETWLAKETDELIIRDLCPTGYEFYNVPRVSRVGGGIGVMHKTVVRLVKHPGIVTNFKSFEFTDVLLKHSSLCLRLIIVYRPQTIADGTSSAAKFFEELYLALC